MSGADLLFSFFIFLLIFQLSFGNLGPTSEDDGFCDNEFCSEQEEQKKDVSDRGSTSLSGIVSGAFKYVSETVVKKVYKLSEEVLNDIAQMVRVVFSEEAFNMVSSAGTTALNLIFGSDKAFTSVGATVLSVSIFVAMIFLNYLLVNHFSLFTVLSFDGTIFLLHGIFGPVKMAVWFMSGCSLFYEFLKWAITHPYMSSTSLVSLFLFSWFGWPYIRRRFKCLRTMSDTVYLTYEELSELDLRDRLQVLEDLSESNKRIEERLKNIETILTDLMNQTNSNIINSEP